MIVLAQKIGQLSLALRSLADANETQEAPAERRERTDARALRRLQAVAEAVKRRSEFKKDMPDGIDAPQNGKDKDRLLVAGIAPALLAPRSLRQRSPATSARTGRWRGAVLDVGPSGRRFARRVDLSIGRSLIVDLPRDAKEVFVANPEVANAVVRSTRKLFVIGIDNGATSIFVDGCGRPPDRGARGQCRARPQRPRQTLHTALPQADSRSSRPAIRSCSQAASPPLGGAAGRRHRQRLRRVSGKTVVASKGAVINSLTIRGKRPGDAPGHGRRGRAQGAQAVRHQHRRAAGRASELVDERSIRFANQLPHANHRQLADGEHQPRRQSRRTQPCRPSSAPACRASLPSRRLTAISGETAKFTAGGEIPIPKSAGLHATSAGSGAARSASSTSPTA